jgi:replicative DNA helicase
MTEEKLEPFAEQYLLGALLLFPEHLVVAMAIVAPWDFASPANEVVFATMLRLHDRGEPVDLTHVRLALEEADQLDTIGGNARLMFLLSGVKRRAYILELAMAVADSARRRRSRERPSLERILTDLIESGKERPQ